MKISFTSAIFMTVGAMVGSAIFSLSGLTIADAGSWSLFSWLIAAAILLGYGLITASLARRLPESGGMFNFPVLSLGENAKPETKRIVGFISAWVYFFGCFAGVVFSAQYIGMYFTYLVPSLASVGSAVPIVISVISIALALAVNLQKIKLSAHINAVLTGLLILALLIYIFTVVASPAFSIEHVFSDGSFKASVISVPIAMVAYGSIVSPAFMAGSISRRNARQNGGNGIARLSFLRRQESTKSNHIAQIQLIAMAIVVTLYLAAIFATLGILDQSSFADNPGAIYSPFTAAISASALPSGLAAAIGTIVNIGAILALFTTQVVVLALGATSIETSAKERALPKLLATKNVSLIAVAIACCILAAFPTFSTFIINMGALFNALFIAIICITAVVVSKVTCDKQLEGKIAGNKSRVFFPILILVTIIACYLTDIINGGLTIWLVSLAYLAIGGIAYRISLVKL